MIKSALNARLLSAAEMVRQDAIFADVGTDHAYLPLFLLEEGRIKRAFCSDINRGPLDSARRNATERGLEDKITFVLADGATALSDNGITDYAVCGMGGELIAKIIEDSPHLYDESLRLILQPMSRQGVLRKFLAKEGFEVERECFSLDAGKYYVALQTRYTGVPYEIDECTAEIGSAEPDLVNPDAQIGFIKNKIASMERAYRGKIQGGRTDDKEEKLLKDLKQRLDILLKRGR